MSHLLATFPMTSWGLHWSTWGAAGPNGRMRSEGGGLPPPPKKVEGEKRGDERESWLDDAKCSLVTCSDVALCSGM